MLKKIIVKIAQWSLLFVGIIFAFYLLLISNISFFVPYLQKYSYAITNRLSLVVARPVEVGSFNIVQHNLRPVLVLHDVNIATASSSNDSSKNLWHINELQIEISVWRSILQRQIVEERLKLDGTTLQIQPNIDGNGGFNINGISLGGGANSKTPELSPSGEIKIYLTNITLVADKWFAQPLTIDSLKSKVGWQNSAQEISISVKHIRLALNDAALQLKGNIYLTQKWGVNNDGHWPFINAQLDFSSVRLNEINSFFPVKIMHAALAKWLKTAFSGKGDVDGSLVLQGGLSNFPFTAPNTGIFKIDMAVRNLDFFYHKDWPMIQGINGHILFSGKSMEIVANSGVMAGVPLHKAVANIDDLAKPELIITGRVNTSAILAQNFIVNSPLQNIFGKYFNYVNLDGQLSVALRIYIPFLGAGYSSQVNGVIYLQNNVLLLKYSNILLHDIRGTINFADTNIFADNLTATLFNRPIELHINTIADPNSKDKNKLTRIVFNHVVPVATLVQHFALPIAAYLHGDLSYRGILLLSHNQGQNSSFEMSSDLRDIAINCPPFLTKSIGTTHDFNARVVFLNGFSNAQIFLYYKNKLSAALNFLREKERTEFNAGEIHFGSEIINKVPSGSGLVISGEIDKVDWVEWQKYLWPTAAKTITIKSSNNSNNKETSDIFALRKFLKKIDIKIDELHIFGLIFAPLHLIAMPQVNNNWLLNLDSPVVSGALSIPADIHKNPIVANLQKLYLNNIGTKKNAIDPKKIPPLQINISDLHYADKVLGKLAIQTEPSVDGLQVTHLVIGTENFLLQGVGKWVNVGKKLTRSFLQGKCTSKDVGGTLKQLHFTESLVNGNGEMSFVLGWQGAFYSLDAASLSGDVTVNIQKGRIINLGTKTNAEIGVGSLLSILGLQTLPRRLTLDFSDLVKDGFSFDTLRGDFKFTNGNALTQNMVLSGPAAQVEVRGRIGFAAKDYDMQLTVIPHLTSSLPIIATVAGGPLVGAATWVADKLIGGQVTRVMGYVYKVKGLWVNPQIQKI